MGLFFFFFFLMYNFITCSLVSLHIFRHRRRNEKKKKKKKKIRSQYIYRNEYLDHFFLFFLHKSFTKSPNAILSGTKVQIFPERTSFSESYIKRPRSAKCLLNFKIRYFSPM